jgi:hypothetical protein
MTKVLETNMENGIDLTHNWDTVRKALKSGRFDYWVESEAPYNNNEKWFNENKPYYGLETLKSVEELIGVIGYPFNIIKK